MKKITAVLAVCTVVFGGFAASASSWLYHGPKNDVVTLIVTANYDQPRLLADLIQTESRQPILFLPAAGKKGNITFCPPVRRGKPMVIPEEKLNNFITFLKPRRIVVLGDSRFVPEKYVKMLGNSAPVFIASGNDWQEVADSLSTMLNITYLGSNFAKLRGRVTAVGYTPLEASDSRTSSDLPVFDGGDEGEVLPMAEPAEASPVIKSGNVSGGAAAQEPELLPGASE